jgi:hypothetical protein
MREFVDKFNQRTTSVIGALVLRGIEHKRYHIASNINYYPLEIHTEVETGSSLIYLAHYTTDPGSLELLRIQTVFDDLISQWRKERGATSSITEIVMCRSHLRIIGMGPMAIPLILREMEDEGDDPDMWFVALQMLTGADPVTDDARGNFKKMAALWFDWAHRHEYVW